MALINEIGYATDDEREELMRIWRTCFGDSEEYVRFFFDFHASSYFVRARVDGQPVGMSAVLPATVIYGSESLPCLYIYALCVLPEYRRRGIASEILDFALSIAAGKGGGLVLRPASEALSSYYKALGFENAFYGNVLTFKKSGTDSACQCSVSDITPAEFAERMASWRPTGVDAYASFDKKQAEFAARDSLFGGGFCRLVRVGEGSFVALGHSENGVTEVPDSTAAPYLAAAGAEALMAADGTGTSRITLPVTMGGGELTAMLKGMPLPRNGFINLTMP